MLDPNKIQLCRYGIHSADTMVKGQPCNCLENECKLSKEEDICQELFLLAQTTEFSDDVRSLIARAGTKLQQTLEESFALASGQCPNVTGDEGGTPRCAELVAIQALLPDDLFSDSKDWAQGDLAQRVDCLKTGLANAQAVAHLVYIAIEQVTKERDALKERVIRDLEAAIGGVPGAISPPGTPGSYARGEHNGLIHALHIVRAALAATSAADELTGCNCRWKGDEQVQWCELHAAHKEAIHDWAGRVKTAEAKLAAAPHPDTADAERWRHVWQCVRMAQHGEYVLMPEAHTGLPEDSLVRVMFLREVDAARAQVQKGE